MRHFILGFMLILILLSAQGSYAQDYRINNPYPMFSGYDYDYPMFALSYAEDSVTSAAVVTMDEIDTAYVLLTDMDASTQTCTTTDVWVQSDVNLRWRADGTNPTSSTGMLLTAGDTLKLSGNSARNLAVISTSTAGTVRKQYFGWPEEYY